MKVSAMQRKLVAIFATFALAIVPAFGLAGCVNEQEVVKQAVTTQLDSLKNADEDQIKQVVGDDTFNEMKSYGIDPVEFYQACYKKFSYKDTDVKVDGDKATVKLNVTNVDIEKVMTDWMNDVMTYMYSAEGLQDAQNLSEDQITQKVMGKLVDALGDDSAPTKTADVEIDLVKKDGQWQAADESQIASALFAGADLSDMGI